MFSFLFNKRFLRIVKKMGKDYLADRFLIPVARPVSWFVVILIALFFFPVLQLPASISHYIIIGLRALLPFLATLVFYRLVNVVAIYLQRLAQKTQTTL
jgi:MscS family membrane protein